jgi:hypothetical protein
MCHQWLSRLKLWVRTSSWRDVIDTTLCDTVCRWLATGRWFSPGNPVSSTNKTDHNTSIDYCYVALNTITPNKTKHLSLPTTARLTWRVSRAGKDLHILRNLNLSLVLVVHCVQLHVFMFLDQCCNVLQHFLVKTILGRVHICSHLFYSRFMFYCIKRVLFWKSSCRLTVQQRVPLVEQKQFTIPGYPSSPRFLLRYFSFLRFVLLTFCCPLYSSFNHCIVSSFWFTGPEYSWTISRWTLNTNQSINQSINLFD